MRKGVVVDLDETIKSIEAATEKAERMAGVHFATSSSASPASTFAARTTARVVAVSGDDREVTPADVRRVVDASKIINLPTDRQIIHALPRYFTVDGQEGVTDPDRHGRRPARGRHAHHHRRHELHHQRAQVRRSEPASRRWAWSSSRWQARRRRLLQEEKHVGVRVARHRRRHDRHRGLFAAAARFTRRRSRSAATSSRATSRSA